MSRGVDQTNDTQKTQGQTNGDTHEKMLGRTNYKTDGQIIRQTGG